MAAVQAMEMCVMAMNVHPATTEASRKPTSGSPASHDGHARLKRLARQRCSMRARAPGHRAGPDAHSSLASLDWRTLMVTDLVGFTSLLERVGDLHGQQLLQRHDDTLRFYLAQYGGLESAHTGDGIIASFENADVAVACALAVQRELRSHHHSDLEDLHMRIGLHAGPLLMKGAHVFGMSVNTAVRVCAQALPGQVVGSAVVRQVTSIAGVRVSSVGKRDLKGVSVPMELYCFEATPEGRRSASADLLARCSGP